MSGTSNGGAVGLFEDSEKGFLRNQTGGGRIGVKRRKKLSVHLHLPSRFIPDSTRKLDRRARADTQKMLQDQGTWVGGNNAFSKFLC